MLVEKTHNPILKLRMKMSLGLFNQKQSKIITITKQNQFGGHEERIVKAQAANTALIRVDRFARQKRKFEPLQDPGQRKIGSDLNSRLQLITSKRKLAEVICIDIVFHTPDHRKRR